MVDDSLLLLAHIILAPARIRNHSSVDALSFRNEDAREFGSCLGSANRVMLKELLNVKPVRSIRPRLVKDKEDRIRLVHPQIEVLNGQIEWEMVAAGGRG